MTAVPAQARGTPGGRPHGAAAAEDAGQWFGVLRRYVAFIAVGNLVWESLQLPLYTIWHEGSPSEIAFAALHCTGGDVLIAGASLLGALLVLGSGGWPARRYAAVAAIAVAAGFAYTIYSEWLNVEIYRRWAYSALMPTLPPLGSGLAPLAQWIVVPTAAFWWAGRARVRNRRPSEGGP